jgi:hypothetical protein
MRCIHVIFIVLVALLIGANAKAEKIRRDGNELLEDCTAVSRGNPSGNFGPEWCYGFIMGSHETRQLSVIAPSLVTGCVPEEVTVGQEISIVVKYLREHPEKLHYPGSVLVNIALNEAFPCKAQPAPQ